MRNREKVLENTIKRCREKHIIIPTYKQMRNPELIPQKLRDKLKDIGLWDLNSLNMFRITWKNEPKEFGGEFGEVNYLELPPELTGVKARIIVLIGKFFPTGAHKVGATFGPLVEKLISGEFDPTTQKALWPSTGNYCRGGAYDSYLLGCESIAVLPEGMSRERFDWLEKVGTEIFATPGTESNVKEIYDKTKELKAERGDDIVVLNQFSEIGNALWHYAVTGPAMEEVYDKVKKDGDKFAALFLTQGSAGTLGSADYLRKRFPRFKVCAGEALQCPTLLYNGFGAHRIEGIGDKHVPWIHNVKNMDMVAGIDDEASIRLMQLFNEKAGHEYLIKKGVTPEFIKKLELLGISSIANILGAIKMAKYYEMDETNLVFTVATDSMEMYQSRLAKEREKLLDGSTNLTDFEKQMILSSAYKTENAIADYERYLLGITTDNMIEMTYYEKKRMHNLKYYTWIEQQGKTSEELDAQWYDENYWEEQFSKVDEWDREIEEFNKRTGLLKEYE